MTIARSMLKLSCVIGAAALLAAGSLAAPQAAMAGAKTDTCKPVKVVQKAKAKAKIHKAKAKAKPAKAKTAAATHKAKPKAKIIKVAAAACDCRKEVHVVKVIQPVIEREVTVYRAEPRPWHAPYVDEVSTGHYASYAETTETYSETRSSHAEHHYRRDSSLSDDYLSADTRPGRHRDASWTRWID